MKAFLKKIMSLRHSAAKSTAKAPVEGVLDLPSETVPSDPMSLQIEGWAQSTRLGVPITEINFSIDGDQIGETHLLHFRSDVAASRGTGPGLRTGFSRVLAAPEHAQKKLIVFDVNVVLENGESHQLTSRKVWLTGKDYRTAAYGYMLDPLSIQVKKHSDIFGTGPSLEEGSADLLALLKRELGVECRSVLDVGCGLGYYGRALRASGYEWMGVEMKHEDGIRLTEAGLPHVITSGHSLPFADRSFDSAICVEVLEHVENVDSFLSELERVARKRVLISVPNVELIPYLSIYSAVPWHMLASDHVNFFTRASLEPLLRKHFRHAEVQMYAPCPLRSSEGLILYYNLFAIAEV